MSMMDDIFDVRDALKDKPELASFDRITEHLYMLEQAHEEAMTALDAIRAGARTIIKLINPTTERTPHE